MAVRLTRACSWSCGLGLGVGVSVGARGDEPGKAGERGQQEGCRSSHEPDYGLIDERVQVARISRIAASSPSTWSGFVTMLGPMRRYGSRYGVMLVE